MTAWRNDLLKTSLTEFPLTGDIGILAAELSGFHQDPAYRIIVATALQHSAILLTSDKTILSWDGPLKSWDIRQ
jgi:PIN domain nuclease of toxin-antitoxin system